MLTIDSNDAGLIKVINDLIDRQIDLSPALKEIGEDLVESTKGRFDSSTAPDGSQWAENSETTILMYLDQYSSNYKKDGGLSSKGEKRLAGKKPLVDHGFLHDTINYDVIDNGQTLLIGSPQKYAAVQQHGATAHEFGSAPWGDIPARPFLGLSDNDQSDALDTLTNYLSP